MCMARRREAAGGQENSGTAESLRSARVTAQGRLGEARTHMFLSGRSGPAARTPRTSTARRARARGLGDDGACHFYEATNMWWAAAGLLGRVGRINV